MTAPKVRRQVLGVGIGGRIAFRVEGHRITGHLIDVAANDPV